MASVKPGSPMILLRYLRSFAFTAALVAFGLSSAWATDQHNALLPQPGATSAQGELTVRLTVVASVGIVIDADGEPRLVVANAVDRADNVSTIRRVQLTPATTKPTSAPHRDRRRAGSPVPPAP